MKLEFLINLIPCHRIPDRCLKINGKPMKICARCFSILIGYFFIPILFLFNISTYIGLLCQIPMFLDGITQKKRLRNSNNILRVLTGLLSGFGLSVIIVQSVRLILKLL